MFDYWRLVELSQDGQYTRYWSDSSKVPYLDGPNITPGLSGAMFWEFSGDVRDLSDPANLIALVSQALSGADALPHPLFLLFSK